MGYYDEYELIEHGHLSDCNMFLVELYYRQFHMHKELELILVLRGKGQISNEQRDFTVKQGDVLGVTGSTGNSTGPHLHFEITEGGSRVDPLKYLTGYVKGWS